MKLRCVVPVVFVALVEGSGAPNLLGKVGRNKMATGTDATSMTPLEIASIIRVSGGSDGSPRSGMSLGATISPSMTPEEISNSIEKRRKLARENRDLDHVFSQNEEWRKQQMGMDSEVFSRTVGNHKPSYLWIGCSDARVPPNEIVGESPGNVFVHRNIGNQVLNTDMNVMAVLQYAVDYLMVPHIIVCGHYDCGGVRAASSNNNHYSPLENWLRNIRDVRRTYARELDGVKDSEERHRRLVELNVKEQCLSLFKTAVVQRRLVATHADSSYPYSQPRIHAMVYDPATGQICRLKVNFSEIMEELSNIYDVYRPGSKIEVK